MDPEIKGGDEKAIYQGEEASNLLSNCQLPNGASSAALSETNSNSYQFSNHPPEEASVQVNNAEVLKQTQVKSKCCLLL